MGWVADANLVIATTRAGGFGFLAGATIPAAELEGEIQKVIKATGGSNFGLNFHMFQENAAQCVDLAIKHRLRAVSYGRGPDKQTIARFKAAGVLCIPTVGALKHAQKAVELGADLITIQGGEGGGHTGSVPTTILLPQVLDTVKVPVIASGGFADGRGLVAALAFGAVGIAMGTRFLLTKESPVPNSAKEAYLKAGTDKIIVTTKLDGIPQRMIRTSLMDRIEKSGPMGMWLRAIEAGMQMKRQTGASWLDFIKAAKGMTGHGDVPLKQAMMAATMPMLIQKAVVEGDIEHGVMATGVVGGRINEVPSCQELVDRIMAEARGRVNALCAG